MDIKMVGPKDATAISVGDLSLEVVEGAVTVPERYVGDVRRHGFRLASEPLPPPPKLPALTQSQFVQRVAIAAGLNKMASVDAIITRVEQLNAAASAGARRAPPSATDKKAA